MGCNCGKKRKPVRAANTRPAAPKPVPKKSPAQNSASKSRTGARQSFALITPNGRTQRFGSRLEAEAAYIRGGRAGVIREQ